MKRMTVAIALFGLTMASAQQAAAQDQTSGTATPSASANVLVPIEKDDVPVNSLNLMVDQVEDLDVIGADGKAIGEVEDVLGDQTGQPKAVVVEVGGFLGVGEKNVILMLNDVSLDMGKLRTQLTKEQIETLPEYGG
ncbi:PRC-barrel domain-containing protein [Fulvimarina manganoxydans]|uniref:PRC-barrel domain-containing protein n=1 Tax=Fulvimarina manganoxydans TaxID=937218 RepID=A0A1W1Z9Y0_9HYPH|nr:PRC-barrel domain-containing protein [Fulvimarina manganoxydans]SMC44768.1 PRC-barrel domain-containing protein [Fulvimarina manganoxydans]